MSVRLIENDERLSVEIEGAVFYYKRLPGHVRSRIVEQYTAKRTGYVNWGKASEAMLSYCLLDWDKVETVKGEMVEFDKDKIAYLPDDVQAELMELLGANASKTEGDLKNLKGTQSSSVQTEG